MKTRTITPNITQLTRFHFVNAFLVREDDGLTLVDTTLPRGADALIAAAGGFADRADRADARPRRPCGLAGRPEGTAPRSRC